MYIPTFICIDLWEWECSIQGYTVHICVCVYMCTVCSMYTLQYTCSYCTGVSVLVWPAKELSHCNILNENAFWGFNACVYSPLWIHRYTHTHTKTKDKDKVFRCRLAVTLSGIARNARALSGPLSQCNATSWSQARYSQVD